MNIFVKYDNISMDWINIRVEWHGFYFNKSVHEFADYDLS